MNYILKLAFLFFIGCELGWCLEVVFRRFVSKNNPERHWINPGFLIGPYLPLYGTGLVALYLMASIDNIFSLSATAQKIFIFFSMAVMMTLIEYITGIIFIRHLKVKLWDYSEEWGNIKGIICPKFSLAWAVLGGGYYFFIHPYILEALAWLSDNLAFSFVIGFFFGIFVIDLGYSFKVVDKVKKYAKENNIIVRYDELKADISQSLKRDTQKGKFLFIFGTVQPLTEQLKAYKEKIENVNITNVAGRIKTNIKDNIIDEAKSNEKESNIENEIRDLK